MPLSLVVTITIFVLAAVALLIKPRRKPAEANTSWTDSQRAKDFEVLWDRHQEMQYRKARGHNVTREETARLDDDWHAHAEKYGIK